MSRLAQRRSSNPSEKVAKFMSGSLVVALLALIASGCGNSSDSQDTTGIPSGDIVVGAAVAKTGYLAPYDTTLSAVQYEINQLNAAGGIDGHHLRLVQSDTRSDPQQTAIAAQDVLDKGAQVVFLNCEADSAAAGAVVIQREKRINFTLCANEPGFGPPVTERYSYTATSSIASEVGAQATFFRDQGLSRPFLLRDTSITYGKAACDGWDQAWTSLGGTIAGQSDFKNDDASIAGQIDALKQSNADSVVLCSYPPGGAAALKQIRAAGVDLPTIAPSAFDGTFWLGGIPNLNNFYVTLTGFGLNDPRPAVRQLFAKMKAAGVPIDQGSNSLAAYSAMQAIADAIRKTKSVNGDPLADELESWRDHPLAIGPTTYTAESHYPRRPWQIIKFTDGKAAYLTTIHPQVIPHLEGQ